MVGGWLCRLVGLSFAASFFGGFHGHVDGKPKEEGVHGYLLLAAMRAPDRWPLDLDLALPANPALRMFLASFPKSLALRVTD